MLGRPEETAKLRAADFFAFARKRHQIHLDRSAGLERPWTDDAILATYRFTNVFRELDRTSVWIARQARMWLDHMQIEPWQKILGVILARTFNRVETLEKIFCQNHLFEGEPPAWYYVRGNMDKDQLEDYMRSFCEKPWVTGAYIVKTPDGMDKLLGALWIVEQARLRLPVLAADRSFACSMEALHADLVRFPFLGGFTAYEIVSDIRWMSVGQSWPDIMTWAHAGPGAVRGLNRVHGRPVKASLNQRQALSEMRDLLAESREHWPDEWPMWEMREVEHTLCEFDKYERVRLGEGTPRGRFR